MASHGSDNLQLGDAGQRLMKLAMGLGIAGIVVSVIVFFASSITPASRIQGIRSCAVRPLPSATT